MILIWLMQAALASSWGPQPVEVLRWIGGDLALAQIVAAAGGDQAEEGSATKHYEGFIVVREVYRGEVEVGARVPITNSRTLAIGDWVLVTNDNRAEGTYKAFQRHGVTQQMGWELCNLVDWLRRGDVGRGLRDVVEDATCSTLEPALGELRASRPVLPAREPLPVQYGGPPNPEPRPASDVVPPVWSHPQDARSGYLSAPNVALVWLIEEPVVVDAASCTARGEVLEVYRGERSVGDTLPLKVPCCAQPGTIVVARDGHLPEHEGQWQATGLDARCRVFYKHCALIAWLRAGQWSAPVGSWLMECEDLTPPPGQPNAVTTPFPARPALSDELVEAMRR